MLRGSCLATRSVDFPSWTMGSLRDRDRDGHRVREFAESAAKVSSLRICTTRGVRRGGAPRIGRDDDIHAGRAPAPPDDVGLMQTHHARARVNR